MSSHAIQQPLPPPPGAMPTLGSPQPAGPSPYDMGQIQAQILQAQRKQELARALQGAGYIPNSGALGAAAMIAAALKGKKLDRQAGESYGEALQRKFQEEARIKSAEQERELKLQLEKEDREAHRAKELKSSPGWEAAPTSVREYEYAGTNPGFRSFLDADRASRGTRVTVNSGPQGPQATKFQEALGGKQAEQFVTWQQDAVTAQDAKAKLAALRQITALQQTGKVQEAQAIVGQYFGTAAGANMQAFNATVGPMVIDLASKLKPLSNADIDFVRKSMPRFGNDPRANQQIMGLLESAADRQVKLYDQAAAYAEQNRSLDGFRPSYPTTSRPAAAPAAASAPRPRAKNAAGQVVEWNGSAWVIAR